MTAFLSLPLVLAALVDLVDPFIGTSGNGHCFPGAACPFGMVQASPDTGRGDWHHCSGYRFEEKRYFGFSQTHLSGTGLGELGDWRILAFDPAAPAVRGKDPSAWSDGIDKACETAVPGYYALTGTESGIRTEVTVRPHAAIYRITPGKDGEFGVLVDGGWTLGGWPGKEGEIVRRIAVDTDDGGRIVEASRITKAWVERTVALHLEAEDRPTRADRLSDRHIVLWFDGTHGRPILLKLSVSARDVPAARRNLAAEIPDWNFESLRTQSAAEWEELLSRTVAEDARRDALVKWYTSLYHLYLQPNDISDAGDPERIYSAISVWDVFRAAWPFLLLSVPERAEDIVRSLLAQGKRDGRLPVWPLWGRDGMTMIGHHAVSMIAEAWEKGCRGFDAESAFALVKETLTVEHGTWPVREIFQPKENWSAYDRYGYYPCDLIPGESVSRTLECSYDDACAARFAAAFGKKDEAEFFRRRARNWTNVIDRATGFARGRRSDGGWRTPFDPGAIGHSAESDNDFTEGNAWQYTWHVLQDPQGLIDCLGGKSAVVRKLDGLFRERTAYDERHFDVDGLIGQYAHGNEPSHHVIYLYPFADRPDRTAELARQITRTMYGTSPSGLCGNEDCGQMSAWYLFTALGFYPLDPADGSYVLGAPQVAQVQMKVGGEGGRRKTFTVVAKGLSDENRYVKSVTLNGKPVLGLKIRHADVAAGGELVFEMTDRPRAIACARGAYEEFLAATPARRHELMVDADFRRRMAELGTPPAGAAADGVPRWYDGIGVDNLRDLGGWTGLDGRKVKTGILFRSAHLATVKDKRAFREKYGVKVDLDLREPKEIEKLKGVSPLGHSVRFVNLSAPTYHHFGKPENRQYFATVFRTILNDRNRPLVFHCAKGADRTGSIAFLLNGLLGVGRDDLVLDWEVTAFFNPNPKFADAERIDRMVEMIGKEPGETWTDKFVSYARSCGIMDAEIAHFRNLMLEER